jgi:hypothetical protein
MKVDSLIYWRKGFCFNISDHSHDRVVIETFRLLIYYTSIHKNFRIGAYLTKSFYSEFYPLTKIITNFDFFSEFVINKDWHFQEKYPPSIKEAFGPTLADQVENVWRLEYPIWLEYESKYWLKDLLGYSFNNPLAIKFNPSEIISLEGDSLNSFKIAIKDFILEIRFGNRISIL